MGEKLRDAVLKLAVKEFLDKDFVDYALSKKKIDPNSDKGKILFGNYSLRVYNALSNDAKVEKPRCFKDVGSNEELKVEHILNHSSKEYAGILGLGKRGIAWLKYYLALFDLRLPDDPTPKAQSFSTEAQEVLRLLKEGGT